jgi:spore maturation protein B
MFQELVLSASRYAIALFIFGIPLYGVLKKVKVYEAFVEGAKEGFGVAVKIIPYLVAILSVIGAFRGSGALDFATRHLGALTERIALPAEVIPLIIVRPLSGGAARGVLADILKTAGPDSYTGMLASIMNGCTETTFYVLAVYCGAVGVTRYRQALPAALLADVFGFAAALAVTLLVFGR